MNRECPSCGSSEQVQASRPRGSLEKCLFPWLLLHPLRCRKCSHRFLRFGLPNGRRSGSSESGSRRRSGRTSLPGRDPEQAEQEREELMARIRKAEREVFDSSPRDEEASKQEP